MPRAKVYLTAKNLDQLTIDGNAQVTIAEELHTKNMKIMLNSDGCLKGNLKIENIASLHAGKNAKFDGKIESDRFTGAFQNNSKINLTGRSHEAIMETSHTTVLNARNYTTKEITIRSFGNSVAAINGYSVLSVEVADQAKVTYFGFPKDLALNEEAVTYQKTLLNRALSLN